MKQTPIRQMRDETPWERHSGGGVFPEEEPKNGGVCACTETAGARRIMTADGFPSFVSRTFSTVCISTY